MKIAVDAMGGDYAPGICVEGVMRALYDFPDLELVLVGHREKLNFYLAKYGIANHPHLSVVHAETVVEMSEPSSTSLRGKKNSSITECARLMKAGLIDGIVTPGHTGAAVAATKVLNRTLEGIDRPALAATLPRRHGNFLLMDAGANTDCTPVNLVQFALMAEVYAEHVLGVESPSIGLISVGGEDAKGNGLTKETFKILERLPINFVGNVEGNTAFEGACDVLISDGFCGNVMLKTCEGLARLTRTWLRDVIRKNALRLTGAFLAKNAFLELKAMGDADELGGAPLLGINGVCIVGHGSSSPKAVRNAIHMAQEAIRFKMNEKIHSRMEECHATTREVEALLAAERQENQK